jgi:sulfoxide reductase heme-binding subunit YedZ
MSLKSPSPIQIKWIKAAVFAACLIPLALLTWRGFTGGLGANPIEYITHSTGWWTLTFLLVTLLVTPLRRLTGLNWVLRLRRMLGLFAFFHVCLHFTTYIWLDQFFDWMSIVKDVAKRPFITVGSPRSWLIPLAATSTNAMVKRLGARRWQLLHRLVYAIAILGVVHYWWLVKKDITEPVIFAILLAILLGARLLWRARKSASVAPAARAQSV